MAINRRQRTTPAAVQIGDVRVANGAGVEGHLNFTRFGLRQFDLFDGKRLAKGMGDGGFDTGHFGSIEIVPQG